MTEADEGKRPEDLSFPTTNEMPDLSDLSQKLVLTLWLNQFFRGTGPRTSPAVGLVVNFVRLVVKAVREYQLARTALDEFVNADEKELAAERLRHLEQVSPGTPKAVFVAVLSPIFTVSDHLETCVGTVKRAIAHARAIRRQGVAVERREIPNRAYDAINDFRVSVEHTERLLREGKLQEGDFVMPSIHGSTIYMGKQALPIDALVTCLSQLHALATRLANGDPPS
jgi:hypothetical protein